ncbi:PAS domain S-box protein [Methanolobus profundi]|uniref:histidine kinase n=1 Tax=Methanolobus profundi TaxID=487685 RepID=A0A1I4PBE2_9EURY|nr:PAS domain S-box protein [Methanolobus profundi]SFM24960.1 PAS domain S-box-containing protein [Methanolobus profundi]
MSIKTNSKENKMLAFKVTIIYAALASMWIMFSDRILAFFISDIELYMELQTYKGGVFVFVTGSLLYLYLDPRVRQLNESRMNLQDTELLLEKRLDYEMATAECMHILLEKNSIENILPRILKVIDRTVKSSRSYIFMNGYDDELGLYMSQIAEVASHGIEAQIDNPELQRLPYSKGAPSVLRALESRHHFAHLVEDLDEPEKTILADQDILSVLILPIFAGQELWGFIGFDDCEEAREWHEDDIKLLEIIADGIGEAIYHKRSEDELKESEERFKILHNATFGGILIHDKGTILDCNQGLYDMSGYSKEELIGKDGFILVTKGSKNIILEKLASDHEEPYEAVGLRKDGTEYPIRVHAKNLPYNGKQLRVTEIRDITEQKEAYKALEESEAKHSAMIANIADVIAIVDKDGINKYGSSTLEKWFGWTQEDAIGESVWRIVHPDDLENVMNDFEGVVREPGSMITSEGRFRCKNGEYKWVEYTAKNLLNEPHINGILINYHDITERKEADIALKESEERFKALHNASFGGIFIHQDGIIIDSNLGLSEISGYTVEELIGMDGTLLIAERCRDKIVRNMQAGYEEPYEAIGLRKDGTEYPVRINAKNIPYKGKMIRSVEFRDITEEKKAEDELRESEERFKALHNSSFGGITIHDKGVILDCNLGLSEISGYSVEELIGMNGLLLIAEGSRDLVMSNICAGYEEAYEAIGLRKDGTEYPVRLEARNIPYKGKQVRVVEFRDITDQKEAERSLRESEEKQSAMIANIADVIAIVDAKGIIRYKSPNIRKWFGWEPEDVIGNPVLDNIHPDDKERLQIDFVNLANMPGSNLNTTTRYLCKDGTYKWIEFIGTNLIDEPAIKGILFNYRDITERKEAVDSILENEERQRAMIANSTDVIAIIDDTGINRYKSPNVEKLFGWKPEELVGNYMWDNIHPEELELIKTGYPVFVTIPGAIYNSEVRYRCKDGDYKWIEYTITNLLHEPAIKGILLNYHDITERKQAEGFLLESERKFRNYIENAPYGIFIMDHDGNYLEVNRTACELTGYEEDELTKLSITDLIAPESLMKAGQSFDELKLTGFTSSELLMKHKDGTVAWIRRDATKLSDDRYIVFASDITEKKKAELSLLEAKMLAEDNSRIKSEFLANMSHELRTPLTAVIGFSDILGTTMKGDLSEKQLGYIEHINKSGKHLLELINDILDISKIEAGKMELKLERFNTSKVLKEVQESMLPLAGKKNIEVRMINEIDDDEVFADKMKLQQIMLNLLSNAIKFTPDNGNVSIKVRNYDGNIEFSVSDTGIGIPKEKQEDIFDPFTQVDASSKRRYGGTGLGLALVRQFVEMHDGKIWLESEEGKGSTFTFTIGTQDKNRN